MIVGTYQGKKCVYLGGKYTGYPATSRHNLMIRLVASYLVKNVISTWIRLAAVRKLTDFENLRLPVAFRWQRGEQTQRRTGDVTLKLWNMNMRRHGDAPPPHFCTCAETGQAVRPGQRQPFWTPVAPTHCDTLYILQWAESCLARTETSVGVHQSFLTHAHFKSLSFLTHWGRGF